MTNKASPLVLHRVTEHGYWMIMARCHRCGSRSAKQGYCPSCRSLDPFPWRRRLLYAAVIAACAMAALAVLVLASR